MNLHSATLKTQEFIVEGRSFSVFNDGADGLIGHQLQLDGTWESWQLEIYRRVIKPHSVCLDVGANIGTSAIAMATYATRGRVVSFEPVKHTFSILERNISTNGFRNVETVNIGLSNEAKEVTIVGDRTVLAGAHQINGAERPSIGGTQFSETVRLESLDQWAAGNEIRSVNLIKVDVEGYELEVLKGGTRTILGNPDIIAIFEFAVEPQRHAGGAQFPGVQKDVTFLHTLLGSFEFVFLIGRDTRLRRVTSYAHLRTMMLGGYPVDDLLCCNAIPPELEDMIETVAPPFSKLSKSIATDRSDITIWNRYADGWGAATPDLAGTRAAVVISRRGGDQLALTLGRVDSSASPCNRHPVLVAVDNTTFFVDPTDQDIAISIALNRDTNWIFLETQHSFSGQPYFGNPSDNRMVGFRFSLPDLE